MKKMIVFDLDGTLVDTRTFVIRSLNDCAHTFDYKKLNEVDVRRLRNTRSIHFLKALGIPLLSGLRLIRRIKKMLSREIANMSFVPGMREALLTLKSQNYILGVATSNSLKNMRLFFDKYEGKYFDFKEANGDETRDIIAAKKAGVHVIAVTWGFNSKDILSTLEPDCIVDSPEEIVQFMRTQQ
jgi:phosphoglycolate phosphatase-like HAD superfamily hydrolase